MKASRNPLLILFALVSGASLLHAASDPRGTYNGTLTWTYTYEEAGPHRNTSQPLVVTVADGPSAGSYRVELRPTANGTAYRVWDPASNPTVHESWTASSFVVTETEGNHTYKFAGSINGSQISGNYADNYSDTLMIGCTFTATKAGGGLFGGGSSGSSGSTGKPAGHLVKTGSGNDADDYTWVPDNQPPGISGVNDVPGPADLPETGTGILLPGLLTMAGIGLKSLLDSSVTPPPTVDYGSVPDDGSDDGSGDSITDSMLDSTPATVAGDPTAATTPPAPSPYGEDYDQAVKDSQSATSDYNDMMKQYADFKNGADTTDPQYQVLDQQYKDRLDYLKNKADSSSASADGIAATVVKQQNTQVLKDYWGNDKEVAYDPSTGEWHDTKTGNLFNPDAWQKSQQETAAADNWGQSETQKFEHQQDADSKAMNQLISDQKQRAAAAAYVTKIEQEALKHDLWNPGGPGDAVDHSEQILKDIYDGKPIDWQAIKATRQYTGDSIKGAVMPESSLSDQPGYIEQGALGTIREIMTGKDADGKSTFLGTLTSGFTRLTAGVATGGVSEIAYTAANMGYSMYDTTMTQKTYSTAGVAWAGLTTMVVEGGPTVVGGAVMHYLPKYCPNVAAGIDEMMQPVVKNVEALDNAIQKGSNNLSNRIYRTFNPLDESLQGTRDAVDRVLASGNPADISKLYSEGGMQKLANLQKAGGLTTEEAQLLNQQLAKQVNASIDNGTSDAIAHFRAAHPDIEIKSVTLGDSGSSASGLGNSKIKTDFDITHTTDFNATGVSNHAEIQSMVEGKPVPLAQANQQLQEELGQNITEHVDRQLRANGFSRGIEDVDFKTYNGIGKTAGQGDCYPPGFTTNRMAVQGRGKIFEVGSDGSVTTHKISGQAVVDQHGLNQRSMGIAQDVPAPDTFHSGEFKDFSAQQLQAVDSHSDVKSLAKAMGRESDLSTRLNHVADAAGDPTYAKQLHSAGLPDHPPQLDHELVELSQKINKNPSNASQYLHDAGYNEDTYAVAVRDQIRQYHTGIGGKLAS